MSATGNFFILYIEMQIEGDGEFVCLYYCAAAAALTMLLGLRDNGRNV
jgi:hypothetical protein